MKLQEYPDRDMMMIDLAQTLAGELNTCLMTHDHASFAVPGGTTPGPVFDALCAADLDWSRVHVMPTDERWVDETSERSNARLIKSRLLTNRAKDAVFVSFFEDGVDAEDAMHGLSGRLDAEFPISVLLLGMGADMHTASLFPGAAELPRALSAAAPVMAIRPEGQETRVTLTGPALSGAMSTHVLISGNEKREALERAQGLGVEDAPINLVLGNATVHWAP
ncbi:6-phosphogluconolactonase [uncultured Litoreibacter sp.]|uniref:6-phosphogluconolactonase n=1 Tax=uncultured Litoreibacter sp. TaxID=1392394 RepID=UPI00261C618A|nr:6-phosphogluconolactonase [uncultured Litoreibacter sp.]